MSDGWPRLTRDLPGIGGRLKLAPEDFLVAELPLYPASGEGTHLYFQFRKRETTTMAAIKRIARHLGRAPEEFGYAGLKDSQAVTTQWASIEHANEERLLTLSDSRIEILTATRHANKLKTGHLAGNRFAIKVREAVADGRERAQAILTVLHERGVPNYFGEQRFGSRGDGSDLGAALVAGDDERFLALYLGRPRPDDPPDCRAAREAWDRGEHARALELWPRHYDGERRVLAAALRRGKPGAAVAALDRRMKRLYVSAFQSRLFNEVLALRIDTLDQVMAGDLAAKSDTGGIFWVEDVEVERARAKAFAISATGPIFGHKAKVPKGEPGRLEAEVAAAAGITPEGLRRVGSLKIEGTRRPLRFPLREAAMEEGADERGAFLLLSFVAPPGCYATVVMDELMKLDGAAV